MWTIRQKERSGAERHGIGEPCPFCGGALAERRAREPRNGGRRIFAYCAHDDAAWECDPPLKALNSAEAA